MSLPGLDDWLAPSRPLAPGVSVCVTTRAGTFSPAPWDGFNLGLNCGDEPGRVTRAREHVAEVLGIRPVWLAQVHGTDILDAAAARGDGSEQADGCISRRPGDAAVVLTADCVPVVLARQDGTAVGAIHAGWRGLQAGILERACALMAADGESLAAWVGPAICAHCYQVDAPVRDAFVGAQPSDAAFFHEDGPGHWRFDLPGLSRQRLIQAGVEQVSGGDWCTVCHNHRFYSHRQAQPTGRFATLIWLNTR
ncbi:MAG: peptidoglycan editing factor PgeF [Alcanivoracaceae bacterium]